MRTRKSILVIGTILTLGCASFTPPPQLSPLGDTAFYGRKAIIVVGQLQDIAIDAEKAGAIETEDARKVVLATKEAGRAGILLADALNAGVDQTEARRRAAAMIRSALEDLPQLLKPQAQALVEPYIRTINVLLSAYLAS